MARIRSVHPGLFTDAEFAFLSDAAQIFAVGLWTECDDQGAFEWKPRELKLRLRPGKDGSIEPLLAELEAANIIMSYEHDGRKYGLVRNFKRFQRPKKPNSIHFIPPHFRTYVGSSDNSSNPDADETTPVPKKAEPDAVKQASVPPKSEKSSLMEDGGKDGGWNYGESNAGARDLETQCRKAAGWESEPAPMLAVTGPIQSLIDAGADLELDVLPTIRALAPQCRRPSTWKYFVGAIAQARDDRIAAAKIVSPPSNGSHRHARKAGTATTLETLAATFARRDAEGSPDAGTDSDSGPVHPADLAG